MLCTGVYAGIVAAGAVPYIVVVAIAQLEAEAAHWPPVESLTERHLSWPASS